MHRLLQGDVGAGKTVVALATLLFAVQGGFQGAFMVPTEVLAEQHHLGCPGDARWRSTCPIPGASAGRGRWRSNCSRAAHPGRRARAGSSTGCAAGSVDILIGTHALITEEVEFSSLGAVVIDEQHRFGVDQRAALREKGSAAGAEGHDPDLLVMTATPIPRTAAMAVFGDLDYSVLDELPAGTLAGRRPAGLVDDKGEAEAWSRVRAEVATGHQAFVVCPLIAAGAMPSTTTASRRSPRTSTSRSTSETGGSSTPRSSRPSAARLRGRR